MAGWSASRGAVVYYSASGAWSPKSCPPSTDSPPFSAEDWTPASAGLAEWRPTQSDLESEKALLFKFNADRPSVARYAPRLARLLNPA